MLKVCVAAVLTLASLIYSGDFALAENRVALVIGNSRYVSVPALTSPAADAKAFADLLTSANFQVIWGADVAQIDMRRAVRDFSATVAAQGPDTVVVVYYAGYGIQLDGENFLIPTDAQIQREADVAVEALRLTDVLNAIVASPAKARFFIVDAANGNPFAHFNQMSGRGLALTDAPANSLVAFSAAPGTEGANRPFTATLINAASTPGIPFDEALGLARIATFEASNAIQLSWESSKLTSGFALFPGNQPVLSTNLRDKPAEFWRTEIKSRQTVDAFRLILGQDATAGYEEFLQTYPQVPFAGQLRSLLDRRQEMLTWHGAWKANSISSYEAFLAQYPMSDLVSTTRRLLDRVRANFVNGSTLPVAVPVTQSVNNPLQQQSVNSPVTQQQVNPQTAGNPPRAKKKTATRGAEPRQKQARQRQRDNRSEQAAAPAQPSPPPIGFGIGRGGFGLGPGGVMIGIGR